MMVFCLTLLMRRPFGVGMTKWRQIKMMNARMHTRGCLSFLVRAIPRPLAASRSIS